MWIAITGLSIIFIFIIVMLCIVSYYVLQEFKEIKKNEQERKANRFNWPGTK